MRVALLFPPATDPRGPHLSLPSLAAYLRQADIEVVLHDLDIDTLLWWLDPTRLTAAAQACERHARLLPEPQQRAMENLLGLAPWVIEHSAEAVATLRDLEAFLDPDRHHQARRTLNAALRLVSGSTGGRVRYAISPASYEVDGIDPSRLRDLLDVTSDPTTDLFREHTSAVVLPALAASAPDVVGLSILNRQQVIPGLHLARRLKQAGHVVVLGGTVYAKFHEALRERPAFFDAFCDGLVAFEGEHALVGMVEALAAGRSVRELADVPNLLSLDGAGRVVAGPTKVEDVKALPTPDFTGMPLDRYLNPVPVLPIVTGKGCYFNKCKFCDIPSINSISPRAYRVRDATQIAADIAELHARHGARHFEITDEALSPTLLLRLADALEAHPGIDPRFVGYARLVPGFSADTCRRLYAMGMRKLFFGLESGNQEVLDHMVKGVDVDEARTVLRNCVDAGIAVHVFSIVGFPEETERQARDTLSFLLDEHATLDAPMNTFDVHPFGLDLRTEYGDNPERYGIEVAPDEAPLDFPITLRGWRNTRGIDAATADRLIAEFSAELRSAYRGWRAFPEQQWAGFEEYAVVYGDHYDRQPFLYRMALPETGSGDAFSLRWADHVQVGRTLPSIADHRPEDGPGDGPADGPGDGPGDEPGDGMVLLRTFGADLPVPAWFVSFVNELPSRLTRETLRGLLADAIVGGDGAHQGAGDDGAMRDALDGIDQFIASRALWLRPVP